MERDEDPRRHVADALAADDQFGWFDRLYREAAAGRAVIPWDRGSPHALLVEWAEDRELRGPGRSALVVGSGLGDDAEYVASRGFATTAFDVSETAVAAAHARYPDSPVAYHAADLLDPPAVWHGAFDLVVESLTVQSLPRSVRAAAAARVAGFVAPGGTLLVIASALPAGGDLDVGPPWLLTRPEVEGFATPTLRPVRLEEIPFPDDPAVHRWRAELRAG